jgi:Predicted membrane protein (DUF2127)
VNRRASSGGYSAIEPIRDPGVAVIVVYKLAKAGLQAAAALALFAAVLTGTAAHWHTYAVALAAHGVERGPLLFARLLLQLTAPHRVRLVATALALDAALSFFEGWALHRRYRWAPWLIVAASASLMPFEVFELLRSVRPGRLALLVINLAVVLYLGRRALRDNRRPSTI